MRFEPYLRDCFGRGDEDTTAECPCPPRCRELCVLHRRDPSRSSRGEKKKGQERPYWVAPADLLWCLQKQSPEPISDGALVTYFHLNGLALQNCRWVLKTTRELADLRDKTVETVREHLAVLERVGLIVREPMRALSNREGSNERAILVPNLPAWYRTPKDITEAKMRGAKRGHEEALARFDRELDELSEGTGKNSERDRRRCPPKCPTGGQCHLSFDRYTVVHAKDGIEGLAKLRSMAFAVALVDENMPRMNGIQLAMHAHREGIPTPLVMVSNVAHPRLLEQAERVGVRAWVIKGTRVELLAQLVDRLTCDKAA